MAVDIHEALRDPEKSALFGQHVASGYLSPAFGALSKSEIDLLVFTALIRAAVIDPDMPIYDLSRALNVTPSKVRALIFNWQLRDPALRSDLSGALRAALAKTRFSKDGTLLTFGIESPLLKEEVAARLRAKGVFADASFSREIVRMPVDAFAEFLDEVVDPETKKNFLAKLVEDKQLKDKSFKAIAAAVLGKVAEKVAGEVGHELAGDLVEAASPAAKSFGGFLLGLVGNQPARAANAASELVQSEL